MREFRLPDVGEGVHEGELIEWLVEEGDAVAEDQPVAKVETDKALVDVPAPVDGTVRELRWSEGDVVPVGEVLLSFDVEGEVDEELDADVEPADEGGAGEERASDAATDSAGERESGAASGDEEAAEVADEASAEQEPAAGDSGGGRVFAAPSVRRLAREHDVDLARVESSGPGGRVTAEDVRAAAAGEESGGSAATEADAAATPTDAAAAAVEQSGGAQSDGAQTPSGAGQAQQTGETPERDRTLAAPATRRVARELDVDLDAVPADEERDGQPFVTEEAVREYAEAQREAQAADAEAVAGGTAQSSEATERPGTAEPGARERREPYRGVRRSIGEAMAESKFTAPHATHTDDVDVTRLVEVKERLAERAAERGIDLTFTPFVLKAVAAALQEHPELNAKLDEDAEEIVYEEYYDLGVATATDAGLLVPVLEGVDEKGLLQIASELNELVEQARDRTIAPEDLRGSTFTVTNVGAIGGEYATPIVNYPEVAILALGQIRRKPRVVEAEDGSESIEPRSVLPLSLSFDHRVVDGAIAARFTNSVRERLREPELLLLER